MVEKLDSKDTKGHLHPVTQTIREIYSLFYELGFEVVVGPELEYEYYNFDVLNFPTDHPARDMQDTFWIKEALRKEGKKYGRRLLATQTSAGQVRYMETHKPPMRTVVVGKVFRNEATDASHEAQFYQVEPLYVDKKVSLAHLKGVLEYIFKKLFGEKSEIRFRPSFFPFTEPSVEVDVKWGDRWLEVVGAGLVHPNVLRAGNVNPDEFQGFAFAFGLDRIVMLKHGIDDIRRLYDGDLRFVNQF
ncbi:MAG: phenylalanine--tRNA ligase subunit alpha [Candidatus Pacebacteria bacterium]|nr:phenylalanine--tRNA ligase subunit alpha [Candidatus Paceibacterota bacterium]